MERNAQCFCGSGKKYERCHDGVKEYSKLADMHKANTIFDNHVKVQNLRYNCLNGCSICCHDYFYITENEFLMILEKLLRSNKKLDDLIKNAKKYSVEFQKKYPEEYKKLDEHMKSGDISLLGSKYYSDSINEEGLPACILLDKEQRCMVYEARPHICRAYGTTNVCRFVKNKGSLYSEYITLQNNHDNIEKKDRQVLLKRPYPLFYWFSTFLEEPYVKNTLLKLHKINELDKDDYYEFTKARI